MQNLCFLFDFLPTCPSCLLLRMPIQILMECKEAVGSQSTVAASLIPTKMGWVPRSTSLLDLILIQFVRYDQ